MKNVFNHFYKDYDEWYETKMGKFVDEVETDALFELLKPKEGMKILDVGCGTGNHSLKLAKIGCDVTGIDIAPNMLNQAIEKSKNLNIEFKIMNCIDMDFADNTFDAIISTCALEFTKEVDKAYKEMFRVIKKNGVIVIGAIQKGGDWYDLYTSEVCKDTAFKYANFFSGEDLIKLDSNNFEELRECLFVPPRQDEKDYNKIKEKEYAKSKKGGFVCVSFRK